MTDLSGFGERLQTLPISAAAPVSARMAATLIRARLALSVAIVAGFAFGFRMTGGPSYALAFRALCVATVPGRGAGRRRAGIECDAVSKAISYMLFVPQLLLFMLSTGIAPEKTFPDWLRPWVRNQPVSQVAETLRGLGNGHVAVGQHGGEPGMVCGHGAGFRRDHGADAEAGPSDVAARSATARC